MLLLLAHSEELFITGDIIADESLDKRRLLDLAVSGRHRTHYLWLLKQSYSNTSKNPRKQANIIFAWYAKGRADFKMIHDETNLLTEDELVIIREFLRVSNHACLYIRNEHSCTFKILNLV